MQSSKAHLVTVQFTQAIDDGPVQTGRQSMANGIHGIHEFSQQCLRILRCTARAMINSPGGLRFKADSRPWLEDLPSVRPASTPDAGRHGRAPVLSACN